jgi:hypothetical protein
LQDVVQDEYVRRMTTEDEMRRILADPRVFEGARGRMRHDLDLRELSPRRPSRAEDPPEEANIGRGVPASVGADRGRHLRRRKEGLTPMIRRC